MPYIESEQEAIEQSIDMLKNATVDELSLEDIKIHDHNRLPLCSNAYSRKSYCAYASVCDCCILMQFHEEWNCLELIKKEYKPLDYWRTIFITLLEAIKDDRSKDIKESTPWIFRWAPSIRKWPSLWENGTIFIPGSHPKRRLPLRLSPWMIPRREFCEVS